MGYVKCMRKARIKYLLGKCRADHFVSGANAPLWLVVHHQTRPDQTEEI
jgi:hypothetical protein